MVGLAEVQGTRRKRVFRACDSCRSMKSKCDGARPACGRCTGYGYKCVYAQTGKRGHKDQMRAVSHDDDQACCRAATALRLAAADYGKLVRSVLPQLPEAARSGTEDTLRRLEGRVHEALREAPSCAGDPLPPPPALPLSRIPPRPAGRYLGEVSDVRFFNLVDRALAEQSPAEHRTEALESYEQDDPSPEEAVAQHGPAVAFPGAEAAERYLDIYFSTIHIAYPFLPRALFMSAYENYLATGKQECCGDTWLATLYIIFAIGAYYDSVSGGTAADALHEQYYHRALALSSTETLERSLNEVALLLAQCFYLLAVCRTDTCWTTLGLAVRIAQSIGLHVDAEDPAPQLSAHQAAGQVSGSQAEVRRRVWYSLYVLDRLLALQLGRPPAIHDDDCHLQQPSRLGDADIDWEGSAAHPPPPPPPPPDPAAPTVGDYFVSMIALSKIIGHVLRDLYSPRSRRDIASWLPSTQRLDRQLLEWRRALPRRLRFDFGHTFETSVAFKRQRNMLAIKFHHLRTLVHRPYLCLPLLRRLDDALPPSLRGDAHLLSRYEQVCVAEARETAHLLHNVVDKRDLVHGFPWWQMISCLICASSVLVVASAFARRSGAAAEGLGVGAVDAAALEDDAETCLTVFEALSPGSEGARIARDMMRRLRARGSAWREAHHDAHAALPVGLGDAAAAVAPPRGEEPEQDHGLASLQEWPLEILDSMAWSTQFFDTVDGAGLPESYEL